MQNNPSNLNSPVVYPPHHAAWRPRQGVSPTLVVLICLLLGIAIGWGWSGERAASQMADALEVAKTNMTYVQSNQSELAALLADPQTQIIPLHPSASVANASAVLVWNAPSGHAMLVCQELWPLSEGHKYQLTARTGQSQTVLASFSAAHGVTAVQFHIPSDASFSRFELSSGAASDGGSHALFTALRS